MKPSAFALSILFSLLIITKEAFSIQPKPKQEQEGNELTLYKLTGYQKETTFAPKGEEFNARLVSGEIKIEKDIPFGETVNFKGEKETLLLDIYSPAGVSVKNRPAILWMHGGGFRYGNDKMQSYIVEMASRFAKRGYICLSINYRLRENPRDDAKGTVKDALEDAMKGLNWLRKNSERLGVNKEKIVIGGGSAGGILGTNFCYREGDASEEWDKSGIVAFINLWGSPDRSWGEFTIDKNDPSTIIVHGTEDASVPFANSTQIVQELNAAGVKNELVTISGAGHTPAKHMDDFEKKIAQFLDDLHIYE